jgi:hypothetical protein
MDCVYTIEIGDNISKFGEKILGFSSDMITVYFIYYMVIRAISSIENINKNI